MDEELKLPDKPDKKPKGYYLSVEIIEFVKGEAERLSEETKRAVSENDVLTAIINRYRGVE